jgi:hypothetical protein
MPRLVTLCRSKGPNLGGGDICYKPATYSRGLISKLKAVPRIFLGSEYRESLLECNADYWSHLMPRFRTRGAFLHATLFTEREFYFLCLKL